MKGNALQRIEEDIAAGDYGKARDRLNGLIATFPNDLTLRRKLGDIFWHLQYPAMAGRYWYLEEQKTPIMAAACQAFERSCGGDPLQILLALKFRGEIEAIRDTFAGQTLLTLQARAKEERGVYVEFGKSGRARYHLIPSSVPAPDNRLRWIGCFVVSLVAVALMAIGLITLLEWVF